MNSIWNEICSYLKPCIENNVSEKEYQKKIVLCLEKLLGWEKAEGELIEQYPMQKGKNKCYADIVVLKDKIEQFVIEVKKPNHSKSEEDKGQLKSYMCSLNNLVSCGIYIGDKIYLYHLYENINPKGYKLKEVLSIEIKEDNPDGNIFVELFSKGKYNAKIVQEFLDNKSFSNTRKTNPNPKQTKPILPAISYPKFWNSFIEYTQNHNVSFKKFNGFKTKDERSLKLSIPDISDKVFICLYIRKDDCFTEIQIHNKDKKIYDYLIEKKDLLDHDLNNAPTIWDRGDKIIRAHIMRVIKSDLTYLNPENHEEIFKFFIEYAERTVKVFNKYFSEYKKLNMTY